MKQKQAEARNIIHFLIIMLMLFALIFGIAFSSLKISQGVKLGSQYRGSFQAVVGVYNTETDAEDDLPNGDAPKAATILQNKMSPFADGSINISVDGHSRLIVTAPRDSYRNNRQLFVNAIQSTGGLFIFDQDNQDIMLSSLMKEINLDPDPEEKSPTSKLLGAVSQVSRQAGLTNRPFIQFNLDNDYFQKLALPKADDNQQKAPFLSLVVDTATVLDNIRNYFLLTSSDQLDEYLTIFLKEILEPIQAATNKNLNLLELAPIGGDNALVLQDFFLISHWTKTNNNSWRLETDSLADPTFIKKYLGDEEKFKAMLFADGNPDRRFEYVNDVSKYVYDSNSSGKDFSDKDGKYGKYYNPLQIKNRSIKINDAFNFLTKDLLTIVQEKGKFNQNLDLSLFKDHFIFTGTVLPGNNEKDFPEVSQGKIIDKNFLIGTETYTQAKMAASQISQTTFGSSFHVFSVSEVNPIISQVMFVLSLTILIILALTIAVFILFFYRLLGFYTIMIAAIIGSLTILMNVVFGIAIGPDVLAIAFILMSLVMDLSIIFFEAFKTNIYLDKRPLSASFTISNRETLGLVVDVLLASLLPNIVLFWMGTGFLKNFATILTMGIFFTLVFGVIVLRTLIYFTIKTPVFKKASWLLPIKTSLDYHGSFIKNYLISYYETRLHDICHKSELTTKDLIKIKNMEDKLGRLKLENENIIAKQQVRFVDRKTKNLKHWEAKRVYFTNKLENLLNTNWFQRLLVLHYQHKIENYTTLLNSTGDNIVATPAALLNDRLGRLEKNTTKIGWITLGLTAIFGILALIFAFTLGLNYSSHFGKGTQYYIYGTYVSDTYENLGAADAIPGIANAGNDRQKIVQDLADIAKKSREEVIARHNNENNKEDYRHEWEALGVVQAYRYLITNHYLKYLTPRVENTDFRSAVYLSGNDYSMIDKTTNSFVNQPWVSITVTNDLVSQNNAIKDAFQIFAGRSSGTTKPHPPTNDYGVLGMRLAPYTAGAQIEQIAITFGILLVALLIYMLIRFKWTYYVALALGLIVTVILGISLVIVLRLPFTIEALAGFLGLIEFSLLTGMLFLGKGKSLIISKNEQTLGRYFDQEIKLQADKQVLKSDLSKALSAIKQTHHLEVKDLDKKVVDYRAQKKVLKKQQTTFYKAEKARLWKEYREAVRLINQELKIEAAKNNFLKEIFGEVLKFGVLRTIFLSSFYLVIGVVITVTLPPVAIMGFILSIGVIISTLVMLTIMLPLWIQLEGRRIRMKYGYKRFVNQLKVHNEEQVVLGLND